MNKFDRNKANYCFSDPILYPILKEHAKRMRSMPTDAERLLWMFLQKNKLEKPFRRQYIIALGFNVIRFTNEDIFTRLDEVINIIKNKIT